MKDRAMNLFSSTTAAVLALTTGLLALPAQAEVVQQNAVATPSIPPMLPRLRHGG